MKKTALLLLTFLLLIQGCGQLNNSINSTSIDVEKPLIICPPSSSRPTLAVMDFEIKAGYSARRQLGDGLSDMLVNALVESQCFRVVERSRMKDLLREQGLGLGGTINPSTAASVGKLAGAQLLVMGSVTEFKENESGGIFGAVLGKVATGAGMSTAHVGLIIRVVDATTGEILMSKSVDKKVNKIGFVGGGSVFGLPMGGGLFKSKAMQDAIEQALIETVGIISAQKARITPSTSYTSTDQQSTFASTTNDCSHLTSASGPKFMVVIPEIHIRRPVPDPAGETEIIRKFLEKGLNVVDQQQIENLRYDARVTNAVKNSSAAATLGTEFGADIIIIGEAFSEFASNQGNMVSCRARVEARAIETSTGRILAANGTHAGGADISELVAGKTALRNAGSELADYFIKQICQNKTMSKFTSLSSNSSGISKGVIRQVQQHLTRLGYSPGIADGIMGGKTKRAIQLYQIDYNLSVDGKATRTLLNSLKSN